MRIFEPHAHMISRTTDDYERMAAAGVVACIEPAFWLGQPRTHVGTYIDYLDTLLGWERYRAAQYGIQRSTRSGRKGRHRPESDCAAFAVRVPGMGDPNRTVA